jgi:hypothetical protein
MANALAYYDEVLITVVKCFTVSAPVKKSLVVLIRRLFYRTKFNF